MNVGALLYSIRREFKTIDDIVNETGIPAEALTTKLDQLITCCLVIQEDGRFLVNFPFWDAPLRDRIVALGFEITDRIAEIVKSEIPRLKELVASSALIEQGYTWDDVALIIVGGLLLDTGPNDRGLRRWEVFSQLRDTPPRPGEVPGSKLT
jgi:hypothetical protein